MSSTFSPFNSLISPGFWQKFADIVLKNEIPSNRIPIWGYYGPSSASSSIQLSILTVDHSSFNDKPSPHYNQVSVRGNIILTNSLQEFKNIDKNALLGEFSLDLSKVEDNPLNLTPFTLLTYADLKSYVYTFWFGFPAISSIKISYASPEPAPEIITTIFKEKDSEDIRKQGFFIIDIAKGVLKSLADGGDGDYGFLDPSGSNGVPSWVIRNYVAYIIEKRKLTSGSEIKLYSLRSVKNDFAGTSCVFTLNVEFPNDWLKNSKVLGWERNDGKISPKVVDLKSSLDPITLSESSVDFNLKLMKWNLFPDFNLEMMHDLKVCILGAGTLGSNVARCLMGWGVRKIDLVDYGTVSYSNPVRQSLYHYKDAGKPKAIVAAENLSQIFPGVKAHGHKIQIPMPGHPVSPSTIEQTISDFKILEELIQTSDVIFLLTDTRESRWAPSVIGAANNKLIINAALGFDSYLVMRHGRQGEDLGCYFCTDVVAPGDSTKDRTLDQQCTVSRPGVSMIAGAFAVELMICTLQKSDTLGIPPHSMRGFLALGQQISPTFQNFDKCSACSKPVVDKYKNERFEFIRRIMDDPGYLEEVSGLDKLMAHVDGIVELDDETSD